MKIIIWSICIIISITSQNVHAYQYFYFDKNKINLSKTSFTKYVIPQLRSIDQEFYSMLKKLDPMQFDLITIKKNISAMIQTWDTEQERCLSELNCENLFSRLREKSLQLEKQISAFQKNKLTGKKVKDTELISRLLAMSEFIDNLSLYNYRLLHHLENRIIDGIQSETINKERFAINNISNLLRKMSFYSESLMIGLIEEKFKSLFESLWIDYIKPIENNILLTGEQNFLIENMAKLNMSWSTFHMQMERGNLKTPGPILATSTAIRHRWNLILKTYLRNTEFIDDKK